MHNLLTIFYQKDLYWKLLKSGVDLRFQSIAPMLCKQVTGSLLTLCAVDWTHTGVSCR